MLLVLAGARELSVIVDYGITDRISGRKNPSLLLQQLMHSASKKFLSRYNHGEKK